VPDASAVTKARRRHAAAFQNDSALLRRTFAVGVTQRYRVILSVRTELEGRRPLAIGSQTYVEGFTRSAEVRTSWRATALAVQLAPNGAAEVEESMDEFGSITETVSPEDDETKKLSAALRDAFEKWLQPRTLRYRELPSGQLAGLNPEAAPAIGENAPPVLTLWLLRALRPAVPLPEKPIRFGERWQEPRAVGLPGWNNVQGSESGEWLEAKDAAEPAVRLYVVQQISGEVVARNRATEEPAAQARFHADALATISLQDGRLLRAERSGLREISRTLEAVPGLKEPQRFSARLTAYVHIQDCQNDPCVAPHRP
jgi:hypothetical protein